LGYGLGYGLGFVWVSSGFRLVFSRATSALAVLTLPIGEDPHRLADLFLAWLHDAEGARRMVFPESGEGFP
jgi:hypothetical protein